MRPIPLFLIGLFGLLMSATGCTPESGPDRVPIDEPIPLVSELPEPTTTVPADPAGTPASPSQSDAPALFFLTLSMKERVIVRFTEITVYFNERMWPYRFLPTESTDTVWEDILHVGYLRPYQDDDRLPVMKCWLRRDVEVNALSVVVTTSRRLPDVRIRIEPADGLIPVRLRPDGTRPTFQSSLVVSEPRVHDSYFDPIANCVYELQGRLVREVEPVLDPEIGGFEKLYLDLLNPEDRRQTLLTVQAHEDYVPDWEERNTPIPTTQPFSPLESWKVAPGSIGMHVPALPKPIAGWSDALLRGGSRSERLLQNLYFMAAHFDPQQADGIWSRSLKNSQKPLLAELQLRDGEEILPVQRDAAWMQRVQEAGSAWQRINEHAPDYNWQHVREYFEAFVSGYPGYGVTHVNAAPPMRIGEPLTLEHTRMLVTLMGLSGRPVILGDELTELSLERLAMLDRILPPQPMRSVDLFEGELPDVWHAMVSHILGPRYLVGLFNWSPQAQTRTLTLADLGIPVDEKISWAVYDVWRERVTDMVHEHFSSILPPESCRLVYLAPTTDIPMLLGDPKHITLNPDVGDVSIGSTEDSITWFGTLRVTPGEPEALMWFVPSGERHYEVTEIIPESPSNVIVSDGPLWRILFQSTTATELRWQVRFSPTDVPPNSPAEPTQLEAQQNTRGVQLTWADLDDEAARYRVYRDGEPIADVPGHIRAYQDSGVTYNRTYLYRVTSINWADLESSPSMAVLHQTPIPISTNLTRLVPLWVEQKHLALREDQSVDGNSIRMAGRRYYHGLGTHSTSRIAYFLGDGYDQFSCHVGIDDETQGEGSAVFEVILDGVTVFTSRLLRGNDIPESFALPVTGGTLLELITRPTEDGEDNDHADWGNPYLHVLDPPQPIDQPTPRRDAGGDEFDPLDDNR